MAGLVQFEVPEKMQAEQLGLLEKASKKGKIKIGVNEVTKAVERGTAKLVLIAEDVSPPEIVMHLPLICKEKGIAFSYVKTKEELGKKSGIGLGTAAAAITDEGDAKKELAEITKRLAELNK
ncbi:MAG: 50S ribosomal protein L7ae [Candidatus Diapherotrites archaeon]|uniref:Large ribosomal subunit protein eL8 n=1 Tax=Candidatus Iainarchaeum sp. TaxID=3101447 RepID=A0A938YT77_9ARCH|nr:50S ribosomal protein L7ae [Candidatus Diapherotrites archaeon]